MARRTAKQRKKEKKIVLALVGVLLLGVLTALSLASPVAAAWLFEVLGISGGARPPELGIDSPVSVHCIDVGQGDAVLLEADGEFALLDAGPPEAADVVVSYLRAAGAETLRYAFMTHPHADHYGGMQKVVEQLTVQTLVLPDLQLAPYPTAVTFEDLLGAALENGVHTETAALQSYPLGSGQIEVVHTGLSTADNYNLLSLGLVFEAGGLRFLNTGDGEKLNEKAMLETDAPLTADVFYAAHHGSNTSNTEDFLRVVRPQMVVISCAAGNSYGHPHRSALNSYEAVGAQVLRTDKDGHLRIAPDGSGGLVYAVGKNRAE